MELQDILTIIDRVAEKPTLSAVEIEEQGFRICVKTEKYRGGEAACPPPAVPGPAAPAAAPAPIPPCTEPAPQPAAAPAPTAAPKEAETKASTPAAAPGSVEYIMTSPLVGTFYASSEEGGEPFVKVGDQVKKGQVLGIVEAMKLMNEIECEYDGTIDAVLIQNADVVEYGQPLFRIMGKGGQG